jgi:hypothetical protein
LRTRLKANHTGINLARWTRNHVHHRRSCARLPLPLLFSDEINQQCGHCRTLSAAALFGLPIVLAVARSVGCSTQVCPFPLANDLSMEWPVLLVYHQLQCLHYTCKSRQRLRCIFKGP